MARELVLPRCFRALWNITSLYAQRIVLFGLMNGPGAAEEAGVEDKLIDNKGFTAEQAIILKVLAYLGSRGLLEAG